MAWVGAAALVLMLSSEPLFAQWEVPNFVAYEGPPARAPDYRKLFENSIDPSVGVTLTDEAMALVSPGWRVSEIGKETGSPLSDTQLRLLELFLEQAAKEISKMGFADPTASGWLDSVVLDGSGRKAIRFYVYDHPYGKKAPWAFYDSGEECNEGRLRKVININTARFAPPDASGTRVIRGRDWATLAHELFHAVIHASEFMRGRCAAGWWISEGVPDAISMDLTRDLRGEDFKSEMAPKESDILKVYGARNFSHPLEDHNGRQAAAEDDRKQLAYRTSSWWRYLAEAKYLKKRNPNYQWPSSLPDKGIDYSHVDYSYLADLFATRNPYVKGVHTRDPQAETRWVNEFLKSDPHIKSTLSRMYVRFISSLANFHEHRLGPARNRHGWPTPTMDQWMQTLFKPCDQASGAMDDGASVTLSLNANAAGCVQAYAANPMPRDTSVDITIISSDEAVLKQLRVGLPDGTVVSGPEIHSIMGTHPPFIARWVFPLSVVRENTFIFTNVSSQPHRTKPFSGEVHFSLGTWESDMTTVPLPVPPPPPKKDEPPTTKREQIKKNVEQALKDPMNNLSLKPTVKRSGYNKRVNCDLQRLRLNMCGPQLKIKLILTPYVYTANYRGTGAMDILQGVAGFGGTNPLLAMQENFATMLDVERRLEARDGDSISISIPKIDYGFSGSFNNAVIQVDKAKDPDNGRSQYFIAIGPPVPAAYGPGEISRPPSGKVTIDEYSHWVLRGSFSAGLVDDGDFSRENPVIVKTVSGTFNIPSPYGGDEDFEILESHFEEEMLQSSLEMMPTGHFPMQEVIRQAGTPPGMFCQKLDEFQLRGIGMEEACLGATGDGSGDGVLPRCSCDCDARAVEELQRECKVQCKKAWSRCPIPDDQLPEGLAAEVAHYRSLLTGRGMPPEIQDGLVDAFKRMPKWQRDLTIQGFK